MEPEFEAYFRSLSENDDVVQENEAAQLVGLVPSTYSNTWPSNGYSKHQFTLNSNPVNKISCTLPAVDQNQILHPTPQIHTSPSTHPPNLSNVPMHHQSEVMVTETPIQVDTYAHEYFNYQTDPADQNQILDSIPQDHTIPSRSSLLVPSMHQFDPQSLSNFPIHQFNSQIPYSFPMHQSSPINELSAQVPSGVPLQIPLPMNQFNLQNVTQVIPSMPTGLVH